MRIVFAIPGDLMTLSGGYGYDRRVMQELPGCGVEVAYRRLPASFPLADAADVDAAVQIINEGLRLEDVVLVDGLAYGALPQEAIRRIAAPIVALCHHPLALETGLSSEREQTLRDTERCALALAAHVIVTSAHTRDTLEPGFGVSASAITIAVPGTDDVLRAQGSGGSPMLLAIGSIIPRKAFHLLVEALDGVRDLDWRLRIVGGAKHSPETAATLCRLIEMKKFSGRIELMGELSVEDLDRIFNSSDIFVSSSLYEGYGMAVAEALARGLPIVTTTSGAVADIVPNDAALKVPPGDVGSMCAALRLVMSEQTVRERLSEASWRAARDLPRWRDTAGIIVKAARRASRVIT
jgi:glycosyltransferase involved in cell wall biosynthesis